jgi:hypothetical protein
MRGQHRSIGRGGANSSEKIDRPIETCTMHTSSFPRSLLCPATPLGHRFPTLLSFTRSSETVLTSGATPNHLFGPGGALTVWQIGINRCHQHFLGSTSSLLPQCPRQLSQARSWPCTSLRRSVGDVQYCEATTRFVVFQIAPLSSVKSTSLNK